MQASPSETNAPLILVEASLTFFALGAAYLWPRLGWITFARIERAFARLAHRRGLSTIVVGLTAILLRLAILPLCPIPLPFVADDFSFLLAANTFLHGRLTNPTPLMWTHFESIHVTMLPTYTSMYFPAQALVLAAGKLLFGHPWFGILATSALMCAAICWMLQAWLPATWALFGGFIAVLHLGLFSYWVNTYHSAGAIGATGGALILGALPRALKTGLLRYWLLLSIGIGTLIICRPYEALLLCLPVSVAIGRWILRGANCPSPQVLMRRAVLPIAVVVTALAWLGYYDYQAFGKATTLPYTVDRTTYAMAPYFIWQNARPEPAYRQAEMRRFYYDEIEVYKGIHTPSGFIPSTFTKVLFGVMFFAGVALMTPLIMIGRVFQDRRIRFLLICVLVMAPGMLIQIYLIPHYVAAFTCAFYAIGLQCMRHLRFWAPDGRPAGRTLVRLTVVILLMMGILRVYAEPLHFPFSEQFPGTWNFEWYGPVQWGGERAAIAEKLDQMPGKQLVIVHYSDKHWTPDEWIYNEPDIDASKVVWAADVGSNANAELLRYYKDRRVWLVQPDRPEAMLTPYSMQPAPAQLDQLIAKNNKNPR